MEKNLLMRLSHGKGLPMTVGIPMGKASSIRVFHAGEIFPTRESMGKELPMEKELPMGKDLPIAVSHGKDFPIGCRRVENFSS